MKYDPFKESYIGLRLREIKHRFTYKSIYGRMAEAVERYRHAEEGKKCRADIAREMRVCQKYWKCRPLHYYRYNQYLEDCTLSAGELKDYIPEFFFYTLFLPYHDSVKYSILLDDKNITENLFRSLSIPTARTLCKATGGRLYTTGLESGANIEEITRRAALDKLEKIFLKPADGEGGKGIRVFHLNGSTGVYRDKRGETLDAACFDAEKNWILQAGLRQHASISAIYPHSVNTFRVATENIDGNVRIVCSVLRIGSGGREVDNICRGGIVLAIDSESGRSGDVGITETGIRYKCHPDTGFTFDGFVVPQWETIREFALYCARKLDMFTYLGWDIALTADEGPVAIEANRGFGIDLFQVALGGLREAFGIDDPDHYWRNAGKRRASS